MAITAKGSDAVKSASKQNLDLSEVMVRLKDGESIKVRLLGSEDYVEYEAISDFNLDVYTQPTREEKDYFVEAGKLAKSKSAGVDEKFESLYPRKRYLIAMADVTTGKLRAWDCSKSQFNGFVSQLEEYKEMIDDGEEAVFTFKRTGNKKDTTYTLQYVPRPKANEVEGFHKFDDQTVEIDFFESLLQPRSAELQVGVLKEKGFPVEVYFPEVVLEETGDTAEADPLDSI